MEQKRHILYVFHCFDSIELSQSSHISVYQVVSPTLWAYVFKKSIIIENGIRMNPKLRYSEDSNFIFKYISHISDVHILHKKLYFYFIRPDSAIHQTFTHDWAEANLVAAKDYIKKWEQNITWQRLLMGNFVNT